MQKAITRLLMIASLLVGSVSFAEQSDGPGLSEAQTDRVIEAFDQRMDNCDDLEMVYRVDCFQKAYSQTAQIVSRASAYWEVEVALTRISRNLYSFVRSNTDKSKSRVKVNGSRVYAVTEAALAEARALYESSVDAASEILRSSSSVELRYFTPIADALEARRNDLN